MRMCIYFIVSMTTTYKNERRQILRIKERRAYRDGMKRKGDKIGMVCVVSSKMEVVSEELGVPGVIKPSLYRCIGAEPM